MEKIDFKSPLKAACLEIENRLNSDGEDLAQKTYNSAQQILEWTEYLFSSEKTGVCDDFLNGLRASIIESIFCISSGLVRMAMFSMRAQIDIGLSWLYFKDHPIEYERVHKSSEGFVMKSEAFKYLQTYYPDFNKRWNKLYSSTKRSEKDPYRLLSAHVHSQSKMTLPSAGNFVDLVLNRDLCSEAVIVQENVSEYLSDIYMATFGAKWMNLPENLVNGVKKRLSGEALSIVLS